MTRERPSRRSQRAVLTCTECARRKIRCSKTIPCSSCVRRKIAHACEREAVSVVRRRRVSIVENPDQPGRGLSLAFDVHSEQLNGNSISQPILTGTAEPNLSISIDSRHTELPSVDDASVQTTAQAQEPRHEGNPTTSTLPFSATRLTNETAANLEFYAHGRRVVLDTLSGIHQDSTSAPLQPKRGLLCEDESPNSSINLVEWDPIFSPEETRVLLTYHQERIAWMHNVVHMPTFGREFERQNQQKLCDGSWAGLYYAIMAATICYIRETDLDQLRIHLSDVPTTKDFFDKSMECLYKADFIANHKLYAVQTICVLLQVAHNIDRSDSITVLVSTAIRIAQSLNIHRLGPEQPGTTTVEGIDDAVIASYLVDRETKKRVWWFLIRQDWLQIPFQNICQIHPSQFNTPMPLNCLDDPNHMIKDGVVVSQPTNVFTQNSYVQQLNDTVIIWKLQDRMCKVGHPGDKSEGLMDLYDQSIWADRELKRKFALFPQFLREKVSNPEWPSLVTQLPKVALLSMAHKILTVHRHFQLRSFRESRFAFTQMSCLSISERSIQVIEDWAEDADSYMMRRMWTTLTHVISCCITLVFASIFRYENQLTYDATKMRRYAEIGRDFIRQEEDSSSIAKRGARLLDALLDFDKSVHYSADIELDVGDVIQRVAVTDGYIKHTLQKDFQQEELPHESQLFQGFLGTIDLDLQMSYGLDDLFRTSDDSSWLL